MSVGDTGDESGLSRSRTILVGATLKEVNGKRVTTLASLRQALIDGKNNKFLTIKAVDNVSRASENVFVALPLDKILQEEPKLALDYRYSLSSTVKSILEEKEPKQSLLMS